MVSEGFIGWQRGRVRQNRIRPVPGIVTVICQETSIKDLVFVTECTRPGHLMVRKAVRWRKGVIPYGAPPYRNDLVT
jgi:hypothetical protein